MLKRLWNCLREWFEPIEEHGPEYMTEWEWGDR
jgi:uncharacterized protein YpbB